MPTVLVTIECREYFTIEVEAETANENDPAIQNAYQSGDWGEAEDIQSDIIGVHEVNETHNTTTSS
jgi:hypothetical protein